jgi:hypothetical protein
MQNEKLLHALFIKNKMTGAGSQKCYTVLVLPAATVLIAAT